MKRKSVIDIVLVALVVIVAGFTLWFYKKELPRSFTINVFGAFTSSAADRNYKGTVIFVNDKAISGIQSYAAGGHFINGKDESWQTYYECKVRSGQWVATTDGGPCDKNLLGGGYVDLSKEAIQAEIKNGALKPLDKCQHLDLCYEILK